MGAAEEVTGADTGTVEAQGRAAALAGPSAVLTSPPAGLTAVADMEARAEGSAAEGLEAGVRRVTSVWRILPAGP